MLYSQWHLIYIKTYVPLLEQVGCGGQPGWYACKWGHNNSGDFVSLLIGKAEKINLPANALRDEDYPHLTIEFYPNTRDIVAFHYSPDQSSPLRLGSRELENSLKALYPALRNLPPNVLISFFTKL